MAKHRELASIVYASTLGRASAARIWRTVVMSGAMLAAPAVARAEEPKQAPVADKAPVKEIRTAGQITADLTDRDAKIAAQVQVIVDATTPEARTAGKAELDRLVAERKALRSELRALKIKPALTSAAVVRAELALTANEAKQIKLAGSIATARTDKQRDAFKAQLVAAQTDRTRLETKLVAAREDAARPRPRKPVTDRPIGRGFILS